jgi:hypothetical protein
VQEADRRGLLKMGERTAVTTRARSVAGVAAGVALAVVGTVLVIGAVSDDEAVAAAPPTMSAVEAPATIPPTTTTPPTTTLVPGDTLPPGPAERPTGLVAGAFYDALVGSGIDPGVARCAADELLAANSEAELLALGIASDPRPPEVEALLITAGTDCGLTEEQLAAAG